MKKKTRRLLAYWTLVFASFTVCWVLYFRGYWFPIDKEVPGAESGPQAVLDNYGMDIKKYAPQFEIPPEFAAALCMMESGGRKPVPSRYEKHIYTRLKWVKLGIRRNYEHITPEALKDAGDEAIQNLASSWGPFQLMGYKCLLFDIRVRDLRGDSSVYWALKWMQKTYGRYIKSKDYKSAFHMHNAGCPFPASGVPKTFHPTYVQDGLKWMKYFKSRL